jgi:hypothetical protein
MLLWATMGLAVSVSLCFAQGNQERQLVAMRTGGYEIGTPEYAQCRMALHQQSAINAAAMQAFYQRQAEPARQSQAQTCLYNGSNIGGITGGTVSCR